MNRYLVRVELHGAEDDDYDDLHEAMNERTFARFIIIKKAYKKLPDATYFFLGDEELTDVHKLAKQAADLNNCLYGMTVAQYTNSLSTGLKMLQRKDTIVSEYYDQLLIVRPSVYYAYPPP